MANENLAHAVITEAGNGFPDVGDYVPCDGELYRIVSLDSRIQTGGSPGAGNWIRATVELADWDDVDSDEDVFAASATILDLVVVERMPECYRASHRAAGNWGRFPVNGAERVLMDRAEAEDLVASDPDSYDEILRDATEADIEDMAEVAS